MAAWPRDLVAAGAVDVALVLVSPGLGKVRDRRTFGSQIATYELLPSPAAMLLGQLLPVAEIFTGGAILVVPSVGGWSAALLFVMFASAVAVNLARGRTELVCACFGARGRHTISIWHVVADVSLAAIAVGASVTNVRPTLPAAVFGVSLLLITAVAWSVQRAWRPAHELIPIIEEEEK